MLTILFTVALVWVAWKILVLGIKVTWGIAKVLCAVLLLPIFIFGIVCVGLVYIAVPILIIVGLMALVVRLTEV